MSKASKIASFTLLCLVFSIFIFFLFKVLVADVLKSYKHVDVTDAIDVNSLASALVFIYTAGLIMATFLSVLFSDINKRKGIFSIYLAGIMSIFIIALVAIAELTAKYPDQFAGVSIGYVILYPNYYSMLFIVYILGSTDTYYIIMFILIYLQALVYLSITGAFDDLPKSVKIKENRKSWEKHLDLSSV